MCGIFSLFSKNLSQLDFEQIKKCFDKIKKRGPDSSHLVSLTDEGSYQSVFFGFHQTWPSMIYQKKATNLL